MKILDVGSGCNPEYNIFLKGANIIHVDIDRRAYHLEVLCDIHLLPFRSKSFPVVHASHILEHLERPLEALAELKRVAKKYVIIKVPNAIWHRVIEDRDHIYSWNQSTLNHLLQRVFTDVKLLNSNRRIYWRKKSKIRTLKRLILSMLLRNSELTAICSMHTCSDNTL